MFILDYHKEKGTVKFYEESLGGDKCLWEAAVACLSASFVVVVWRPC